MTSRRVVAHGAFPGDGVIRPARRATRPKKSSSRAIHSIHTAAAVRHPWRSRAAAGPRRAPRPTGHDEVIGDGPARGRHALDDTTSAGATSAHRPRPWPSGSAAQSRTRNRAADRTAAAAALRVPAAATIPRCPASTGSRRPRTIGAPPQAAAAPGPASISRAGPPSTATIRTGRRTAASGLGGQRLQAPHRSRMPRLSRGAQS